MNFLICRPFRSKQQHGIAMIEALVALLVLALGVLGLARLQINALTESRNTNARAIAVQLAADLSERMQSNAAIRRINPNTHPYETPWGAPAAAGTNCLATPCTGAELAAFDVRAWKLSLQALLPNGDARVFRSTTDRNQFGVLMRWQDFEAKNESEALPAEAALYTLADGVTDATGAAGTGVAGVTCPDTFICHLVYIRP
jgi:type IV pilus assembly protein PilV